MNFDDAKIACLQLKDNWRLPSKQELNLMYKHKNLITNNLFSAYCCALDEGDEYAFYKFFGSGNWTNCRKDTISDVRAVRSL